MDETDLVCPVTGNEVILDIGAFATGEPKWFVCPQCHRLHLWRALDANVIDLGRRPHGRSPRYR
jgi:hypothetical protein